MSQFLIVHGVADEASSLFDAGIGLFNQLFRIQPDHTLRCEAGNTLVARFPMQYQDPGGFLEDPQSWICGAGTWFYRQRPGPKALAGILDACKNPNGALSGVTRDLDGIFALTLGNKASGAFTLVTDRIGSLHVYERSFGACIAYSTSSLALGCMADDSWNIEAVREFLAMGTIFEDRSLFSSVRRLPPATLISVSDGLARKTQYWDLGACLYDRAPREGTLKELAAAIEENAGAIASAFPNPAIDLTGGLDSRAVVAGMLKKRPGFTSVVAGHDADPDVRISAKIANAFHLPHIQFPPSDEPGLMVGSIRRAIPICDGEYNAVLYGRILEIHQELGSRFDLSVNGSNGEICKGYWWEILKPQIGARNKLDARRVAAARFVFEGDVRDLLAQPPEQPIVDHFGDIIDRCNRGIEDLPNTSQLDHLYLRLRMRCWQGRLATSTIRIWPCASPLMWRNVMEIALSTRPATRLRQRLTRNLLEQMNPKLASLPTADGGPALPLRLGTLHRFTPYVASAAAKVARKAGLVRPSPAAGNPMSGLWQNQEIRSILDTAAMCTAPLYSSPNLRVMLDKSRAPGFRQSERLGRILTLELLAQTARAAAVHKRVALYNG